MLKKGKKRNSFVSLREVWVFVRDEDLRPGDKGFVDANLRP